MSDKLPSLPEVSKKFWIQVFCSLAIISVVVSDVVLYSEYQALKSKVGMQQHKVDRLQSMLIDLLQSNQNAEKLEHIEVKVQSIETQVNDLTVNLTQDDKKRKKRWRKRR